MSAVKNTLLLILLFILQFFLCTAAGLFADEGAETYPMLRAESAVLVEQSTGTMLFEQKPGMSRPPASLTKLMTMHIVLEETARGRFRLDEEVPIPEEAWYENTEPGSSLMFLGREQTVTLRELLLGLAVSSGNDAAVACAVLVSGSVDAFAERMNREAAGLGFPDMHFNEAAGLDENNAITAESFARFCRLYIAAHPEALAEFHSVKEFTYPKQSNLPPGWEGPLVEIKQYNRNMLLWSYPDVDGLKTGYIDEAGYNIAVTAERGGMRLIAVALGGKGESHPEGYRNIADDAARLLDYGFANFELVRPELPAAEAIRVWKGAVDEACLVPLSLPRLLIAKQDREQIRFSFDLPESLTAPIQRGEKLGTCTVLLDGKVLAVIDLSLSADIERGGLLKRVWHSIVLFFRSIIGK